MLRHLAFFEALADETEDSPAWKGTSAGLLVLRLVDDWMRRGADAVRQNPWGAHAVRLAVEGLDPGKPARAVLLGTLELVSTAEHPDVDLIAPRLMAYARALDFDGQWALGADVMGTLAEYAAATHHSDLVADANLRLGYYYRMLGRLEDAAGAYQTAERVALGAGDVVTVLRVRVADAKLALARGNLPDAEQLLDETIRRAGDGGHDEVRAIALHDRGGVAYARGDYEGAVRFAYEALVRTSDPTARDRVLADIASILVQLGVRSAARDALLVLAATAQEQYMRWTSMINLMELAALDGAELVFEQHRRELDREPLTPDLAAHYHLYAGQGLRIFGRVEQARTAFRQAIALAGEHRFNQIVFQAEAGLEEMGQGMAPDVTDAVGAPASLRDITDAIGELREHAGIAP